MNDKLTETQIYNNLILQKTADNLKKHFFNVEIFDNASAVLDYLVKNIKHDNTIGFGGSKSLSEINFFDTFNKTNYPNLIDRNVQNISPEQKKALQRQAICADVFICGANGVSMTGELVFIDKFGNRVAGITYGPDKTFIIAGINKIASDLDGAEQRAKDVASVKNNIRFETGNPCTVAGKCVNCENQNRLCGVTTILNRCYPEYTKTVLLVNQDLGY